jgi:hypothetical protein
VKKSVSEFTNLVVELRQLSVAPSTANVSENTRKKWLAIAELQPKIVWLIGPARLELVFKVELGADNQVSLIECDSALLHWDAA